MPDFVHKRTGRTVTVGEGLADRYRNSGRWTELPRLLGRTFRDGRRSARLGWG